ncbi:MAG: UvrD-helicase domain-containing protein [Clostridiales bacterium]|nr:UvrD-helicase domain-containing protein [Clostridiales bacterium]
MDELNEEQLKPVLDTEGAVLVTAGAGSGKTRLLTHRIAYLVEEKGVRPYNILAITFTNKAANEMRERLQKMLPEAADGMLIATFHSMCVRILRRFINRLGYDRNFSIYGEDEKERIVKNSIKAHEYDVDAVYKKAIWSISDAKNAGLSPSDYKKLHDYYDYIDEICVLYEEYQQELRCNNALDYDDLLLVTYKLLRENAEALEYCQNRYLYIHVDEFQDTNTIQYDLVRLIAEKHGNIFAVGDEDQSIYGWRGADFRNIFNFTNDFAGCRVYKLEQNYRSTQNILAAANKLIRNNTARLDKTLWTGNGDGAPIEFLRAGSEQEEAAGVVSSIVGLVRSGQYKFSDIAVLMRLNALSRSFEEKLIQYGIPHKVFGGFKFFERKEIKDLLAYLKVLGNPADNEALVRIINFPKRGIGDGTVAQLRNYGALTGRSLSDIILHIGQNEDLPLSVVKKLGSFSELLQKLNEKKNNAGLTDLVCYLVSALGLNVLYGGDSEEERNRMLHVEEFVASVKQFEESNEGADLSDYLQMISLYSDTDEMDDGNYVSLATVHSAKGLEFKVVYIVGMEESIFPIIRMDASEDEQEERRLFYVAITRARERLFVTYAGSRFLYGQRKQMMPSRFLKEAGIVSVPQYAPVRQSYGGETKRYTAATVSSATTPIRQQPAASPVKQSGDFSGFTVGASVSHPKFGAGTIVAVSEERGGTYAQVAFEKVGKITLALEYAPLKLL